MVFFIRRSFTHPIHVERKANLSLRLLFVFLYPEPCLYALSDSSGYGVEDLLFILSGNPAVSILLSIAFFLENRVK
jgi:hypothetical protein